MPIDVTCPSCNESLRFGDELAGLSGSCPDCGAALTVPATSPAPPAETTSRRPPPPAMTTSMRGRTPSRPPIPAETTLPREERAPTPPAETTVPIPTFESLAAGLPELGEWKRAELDGLVDALILSTPLSMQWIPEI